MTPWLYQRLKVRRELDQLPEGVTARLRVAALQAAAGNLRVDEAAEAVVAQLQGADIPLILLKGVARRALGGHPYEAVRYTTDVDLLVPLAQAREAFELLLRRGYTRVLSDGAPRPEHHHHLPPLWTNRHVGIELHVSPSPFVAPELAWSRTFSTARTIEWQGLQVLIPSPTELAWSTLVHAPTHPETLGFRLRDLLDFAALVVQSEPIDWEVIAARTDLGEAADGATGQPVPPRVLTTWLAAARQLAGPAAIPDCVGSAHFDIRPLLGWRLRILAARRYLKAGFVNRLFAEGARVCLDLPPALPPFWVSPRSHKWRLMGRAARSVFRTWRMMAAGGAAA